ncbi:MAG TPA: hypothetical protein VE218_08435 [Acidobacteriaceae bacterium]|nr:hypothetical protein [Acidobacteriaceae bacterium]
MSTPGPSLEESLSALSNGRVDYPAPPRLHWALILVGSFALAFAGAFLSQLTGLRWIAIVLSPEVFVLSWILVQASFVQRLAPSTHILLTTVLATIFLLSPIFIVNLGWQSAAGWMLLGNLAGTIMVWIDLYRMRDALESHYNSVERYGLTMAGPLLFFFGPFYLQYHLRKIALWKEQQSSTLETP